MAHIPQAKYMTLFFTTYYFGGDQLTATRARGAKRPKMNGITPVSRLEGLSPCAEDWHARMNFLEVHIHT